jgi:uncharacterized protein YlzI (FlbEa/FlbD family)
MKNFITLTNLENRQIIINPSYIIYIEEQINGSYIRFSNDVKINVGESLSEIMELINKSKHIKNKNYDKNN